MCASKTSPLKSKRGGVTAIPRETRNSPSQGYGVTAGTNPFEGCPRKVDTMGRAPPCGPCAPLSHPVRVYVFTMAATTEQAWTILPPSLTLSASALPAGADTARCRVPRLSSSVVILLRRFFESVPLRMARSVVPSLPTRLRVSDGPAARRNRATSWSARDRRPALVAGATLAVSEHDWPTPVPLWH